MTRYCIYCGREDSPENPVVDGVCLECRIKRGEILRVEKNVLRYDICRVCGSVRIGYKWRDTHGFEEAITLIVYEEVPRYVKPGPGVGDLRVEKYEYSTAANWRTVVRVYFTGTYGGKRFTYPVEFTIFFNPSKCPRCVMIDSGEYEAVLQIRGVNPKILNNILSKEFMADKRLREDLVDVIEADNGVNLYFYNHGAARKLARRLAGRLGLRIRENYEVAGTRSGKQRARLSISLKPRN